MSAATRQGDDEYSRADRADRQASRRDSAARAGLAICALAGAASLVVATRAPVLRVEADGELRPALDRTGWDLHGPALLLIAALALPLLALALRGSLAAGLALALCGLAALGITAIDDLPDIGDTGLVGDRLLDGTARAGFGAYAEALGGVLLLAAGDLLAFSHRG